MPDFLDKFVPEEAHPEIMSLIQRAAFLRGQPEDFVALFQPDAVLHMIGDRRDGPMFGEHRGHRQILELLRRIDIEFERLSLRILNVVVDGDRFAVRRLAELRHRGSSESRLFVFGSFVRTRGGLIDEVLEFVDTATARRLMG